MKNPADAACQLEVTDTHQRMSSSDGSNLKVSSAPAGRLSDPQKKGTDVKQGGAEKDQFS